jgi:hypothetical protein
MLNIAAVVSEANRFRSTGPYELAQLSFRAYVRHAVDFTVVRETLAPLIGNAEIVYVQADICRYDLLIEIEAFASHLLEKS